MEWIVFTWAVLSFFAMIGHAGNLGKNEYPRTVERSTDVAGMIISAILCIGLAVALAVTA